MDEVGIETYTGQSFNPLHANPQDVHIEDIAHALSQICRFNGHTKYFYSVGQHSINVQLELQARGATPKIQLIGLLHDAAEAYLCDVPSPIKPFLTGYREMEERLERIIFDVYHVTPNTEEWDQIKQVDTALLAWEARRLMPCKNWDPVYKKVYSTSLLFGEKTSSQIKRIFLDTVSLLESKA